MKIALRSTIAAIALFAAMPAHADIIQAAPSDDQGITVHNDGSASTGTTVLGELGQNSGVDVIFTGDDDRQQQPDAVLRSGPGDGHGRLQHRDRPSE